MPRLTKAVPRYRLHKGSGQAVVRIEGKDRYLGKYGTVASRAEYSRLIAEQTVYLRQPSVPRSLNYDATVNELLAAYLTHAAVYYRKNGEVTGEFDLIRYSFRPLKRLYGDTLARDFTSLALKAVRESMISARLARTTINARIGKIKRAFKWGVAEHLVPEHVYGQLAAVENLKAGRTEAKEPPPVRPVSDKAVAATIPFLPAVVADMVTLQRLTGMRPGEICHMRPCDIDRRRKAWCYRPSVHKLQHLNKERRIYIGPKAQQILKPYLQRHPDAYCFSPADSERQRKAKMREMRKTKVQPSQVNRARPYPQVTAGERYRKSTYINAIRRACQRAGLEEWSPNRLRHSVATQLEDRAGLNSARVVLGHSDVRTTRLYAERSFREAEKTMLKYG
jgi:integrase